MKTSTGILDEDKPHDTEVIIKPLGNNHIDWVQSDEESCQYSGTDTVLSDFPRPPPGGGFEKCFPNKREESKQRPEC